MMQFRIGICLELVYSSIAETARHRSMVYSGSYGGCAHDSSEHYYFSVV